MTLANRLCRCAIFLTLMGMVAKASAEEPVNVYGDPQIAYKWQAELAGPTRKCHVPSRIFFVVGDAIINGKITFEGMNYFPKGRFENSFAVALSLVRFYGDPRPLVSVEAQGDATWSGTWMSNRKGCSGKARISER